MSASLLVDLGNTCQLANSIQPANGVGASPASGVIIGQYVDMINANTFTNLFVAVGPNLSGAFRVGVQTSDLTTSGSFTDPTSGLAALPTAFQSGGLFWVGSGGNVASGVWQAAGFQNPNRYARAVVLSGSAANAPVTAGFINHKKTTGSGGGFTMAPLADSVVNV